MQRSLLRSKVQPASVLHVHISHKSLNVRASRRKPAFKVQASEDEDSENDDKVKIPFKDTMDAVVEYQRSSLKEATDELEKFDQFVDELDADTTPKPLFAFLGLLRKISKASVDTAEKRLKKSEETQLNLERQFQTDWEREEALQQAGIAEDPWAMQDYAKFEANGEGVSTAATLMLLQAFITCTACTGIIGSLLFNVEVNTILPDPSLPSQATLMAWGAWSLPYIGATAALAALQPAFLYDYGTLRYGPASEQEANTFFAAMPRSGLAALAVSLGYTQAVVYQGVWLLIILKLLGAPFTNGENMVDPALMDDSQALQSAMGSLVASPSVAPFLAIPSAVFLTALAEAGWWFGQFTSNSPASLAQEFGGMTLAEQFLAMPEPADENEAKAAIALLRASPPELEDNLIPLTRVFLSSAWLSAETLATRNLWFAVLTGGAGLLLAFFARRSSVREAGFRP